MGLKGNPNCEKCPLHQGATSVCVMGRGSLEAKVMVIGEAPGQKENETGKPFQGKSGKLLESMFTKFGVSSSELYISNVVKCRPEDNRTPRPKEIKACAEYLQKELDVVRPKFILLLGATAVKAQLGGKITEVRGRFIEKDGATYFATFHPAAILRDPAKMQVFETDLGHFFKAVKGGKPPKEGKGLNLEIVRSIDDLNLCLEDLTDQKMIAYDLETTGLSPFEPGAQIVCIGLATKTRQWVIPLYHKESPFKTMEIRQSVVEVLHDTLQGKYLIGHNAKFDSLWLKTIHGRDFYHNFDTMLAHYLLDENSRHGLKELATVMFNAPEYDVSASDKQGGVSLQKLATYCAYDVYYTRKLMQKFSKQLQDDDALWDVFNKVVMPASNAYVHIQHRGVFLYEHKLDDAEVYWKEKLYEHWNKLNEYAIKHGYAGSLDPLVKKPKKKDKVGKINWGSTSQLSVMLYQHLGLEILEYTKKGKPVNNESVMKRLSIEHEVPAIVLQYREAYKQLSSFIASWKGKMVDSRLHPSFLLHGAVTGRTSCREPNLQQVPRDPRIRSLVGAPDGWTLLEIDQSQVELRIAAICANEKSMKLAFQMGEDLHTKTAIATTGKTELTKEERKKAKAVNFGFLYGMGWRKFIIYARDNYGAVFTEAEARRTRERFFETYDGLPEWHARQRRIVRSFGQVRSLIGRVRHLPTINSDDENEAAQAERQAINSPVQGFASDLILCAVVEFFETFDYERFRPVGTVHDSILVEVRNDYIHEVVPKIKHIMENPRILDELGVKLPIPLVADMSVGDWGNGIGVHFGAEPPVNDFGEPDAKKLWYDAESGKLRRFSKGWKTWKPAS